MDTNELKRILQTEFGHIDNKLFNAYLEEFIKAKQEEAANIARPAFLKSAGSGSESST